MLLKNDGALPLTRALRRVAVIGAHADRGVLSGGGSSQVVPTGGIAATEAAPNGFPGALVFDPSSPLEAIRRQAPGASVTYDDGGDLAAAVRSAAAADVALVFADQWTTETADLPDLSLPEPQDKLIEAVARANPRTIVILETGDPVVMPWLDRVAGVLEAWYPGQRGGAAIARVLFGGVDPSGHLPVTFPESERQLPRPKVPGDPGGAPRGPVGRGGSYGPIYAVHYTEGAATGYKWFARRGLQPLFPFGFGLSYTAFGIGGVTATVAGTTMTIGLSVRNLGGRAGAAVPQVYVSRPDESSFPLRLVGWSKVALRPGEERRVGVTVDPRLLARFDTAHDGWRIEPGRYRVSAGFDAVHRANAVDLTVGSATLPP